MQTELDPYLAGTKFSDSYSFAVKSDGPVKPRIEQILELVTDKRTVHIGCCDHKEIMAERVEEDMWLHRTVTDASAACLGVDIDARSVEQARELTGMDNIVCADISRPGIAELEDNQWDVALFADCIEHIPDPIGFLRGFLESYGKNIGAVVITVPNSLRLGNVMAALRSREMINSDHNVEYTPFTVNKLLASVGLNADEFYLSTFSRETGLRGMVFRKYPYFVHTLVTKSIVPGGPAA